MGITITKIDQKPHPPYGIRVDLECESAGDMFCRGVERFENENGYIGCYAMAMDAGWLERQTPNGRIWVCPRCSGKGARK